MNTGTYYSPEQWPREQWERDFDNIAALGLQLVHMGQGAWFNLEPRPGEFQFDWLAQCIEMAQKHKLAVILCTPTAAPPIWLVEQHPEVLPVDDAGRRIPFGGGSQRRYSPTSPAFHDAVRRIVTALAERFGDHPAIIGWQIDNACGSTLDAMDQNDHAVAAFRQWLKDRYASVDALNLAWGTSFSGCQYTDFAQVTLPPSRTANANPHQVLDACRFWSWANANLNRLQADILRPKVGQRFLTTNFTYPQVEANPAEMAPDLSLMSWNTHPCSGMEKGAKDENFRLGDPALLGLIHDYMAGFNGRWGQMELQPGQVNRGDAPVQLYPGAVRLWLWTAFAHGAEFATTDRFRQPRSGLNLFHHGLVSTDGTTPTPGGRQFQQTIDEIARLDLGAIAAAPPAEPGRTVGLVVDFDQGCWFRIMPQSRRWEYGRLLQLWYGALTRLGLAVKVLRADQKTDWPALPMIVAPAMQMVDDGLIGQMTRYAASGGHLVLTCRTALMDRTGRLFEGPVGAPILPLIDGSIDAYDGLPDQSMGAVEMDGKRYAWGVWGDLLYSAEDTRIIARYADQFYASAAAVIQNRFEKGLVTYCGVFGEAEFTNALVEKLAVQSKLAVTPLPPRVQILRRGPYRILLNYTCNAVDAPAPPRTRFVVGTRKVEPAGVAVWKEG